MAEMTLYRIPNWDKDFENNRSRSVKNLLWVILPNKHDSEGYLTIVEDHPNGPAHYACWVTIAQVASRCQPRGTLARDDGKPYDARALARRTRIPAELFAEALPRLVAVGWLVTEVVTMAEVTDQADASLPGDCQDTGRQLAAGCHCIDVVAPKKGREGKGREVKGKDRKAASAAEPDARLLELIDGWNGLGRPIVKPGNGARRDPPAGAAIKGWRRAMNCPERREAFQDIPAILAAIRRARFCHGKQWFSLPWLFGQNKNGEANACRLLAGAYEGDSSDGNRGTGASSEYNSRNPVEAL